MGMILGLIQRIRRLNDAGPRDYIYNPKRSGIPYAEALQIMKERHEGVVEGWIDGPSQGVVDEVVATSRESGISFEPYRLDINRYKEFCLQAEYDTRYPDYYKDNIAEKSAEHFIVSDLLQYYSNDVFVDIACENSPLAEIISRIYGCVSYRQDIMFPRGIRGHEIGSDACDMPLEQRSVSKAALTCSLEHFETDADIRLFRELARVLAPGGAVCVVPLYMYTVPAVQTDPVVSVHSGVMFDPGAVIHCAEGWGNRHGRFYSPLSLRTRILDKFAHEFSFSLYRVIGLNEQDERIYLRFALVATRAGCKTS